jgi:hypothetical protein
MQYESCQKVGANACMAWRAVGSSRGGLGGSYDPTGSLWAPLGARNRIFGARSHYTQARRQGAMGVQAGANACRRQAVAGFLVDNAAPSITRVMRSRDGGHAAFIAGEVRESTCSRRCGMKIPALYLKSGVAHRKLPAAG